MAHFFYLALSLKGISQRNSLGSVMSVKSSLASLSSFSRPRVLKTTSSLPYFLSPNSQC